MSKSKSKSKSLIVIAALVAVAASIAIPAVLAQNSNARPNYTEIKYSADMSSYRWDANDRILVLKGNVKFIQGDTVVLADTMDYRESTRTGTASGNLKIYDDQHTITAEKGTVNFRERVGTLTGNVRMIARPAKSGAQQSRLQAELKDEILITCDKIDYFYQEKKAVVPASVTLKQQQRTVSADSATYFGKDEIIHLVGNVAGKDTQDGHTFSAPRIVISVKENDEWIEAQQATGTFYVRDEDDESEPEAAPAEADQSE